jgi:hypothetical protein
VHTAEATAPGSAIIARASRPGHRALAIVEMLAVMLYRSTMTVPRRSMDSDSHHPCIRRIAERPQAYSRKRTGRAPFRTCMSPRERQEIEANSSPSPGRFSRLCVLVETRSPSQQTIHPPMHRSSWAVRNARHACVNAGEGHREKKASGSP